jgi:ATP-binding cassette subfamily B protein/subfamily B ATP-binding cassette protein MsbA
LTHFFGNLLANRRPIFADQRPASRLLRQTAKQQWKLLGLHGLLSIAEAIGEGATLGIVFLTVQLLSASAKGGIDWSKQALLAGWPGLTGQLSLLSSNQLLLLMLSLAVLIQAGQSLIHYFNALSIGQFAARCKALITARIHSQILSLSYACASHYRVGDLMSYSSQGPDAVEKEISIWGQVILNSLMALSYLVILVLLSPWLLLAAVAMGAVIVWLQHGLLPRIRRHAYRLSTIEVSISARINEDIQALRLLHSFGQLEVADQDLRRRMAELEVALRRQLRVMELSEPISMFLPVAILALITGLSLLVFDARSTGILPSLVTFLLALQRLNQRFSAVATNFNWLHRNSAHLGRLNEILTTEDKQLRRLGGRPFKAIESSIVFDNVSLDYGTGGLPSLRQINLSIPRGKTIALVGASGSGKSSLADLLVGLYAPTKGRILIDGVDLGALDLISWQQKLGVVSQDTFLFNASLRDNIAFGKPQASDRQIEVAAEQAQAAGFIRDLPEGFATLVGERGYRLSGGQRQRISLARALLRKPDLLILDEATSALDSHSEHLVQQALKRGPDQCTLVIAHRLSTIREADQIVVLDHGQIVEMGSHGELLKLQRYYAALWQQQSDQSFAILEPLAGGLRP